MERVRFGFDGGIIAYARQAIAIKNARPNESHDIIGNGKGDCD